MDEALFSLPIPPGKTDATGTLLHERDGPRTQDLAPDPAPTPGGASRASPANMRTPMSPSGRLTTFTATRSTAGARPKRRSSTCLPRATSPSGSPRKEAFNPCGSEPACRGPLLPPDRSPSIPPQFWRPRFAHD
jgi:hypothetical protein